MHKDQLLSINYRPSTTRPPTTASRLSPEEGTALDALLEELLDSGRVGEAAEVATHFGYNSLDLTLIMVGRYHTYIQQMHMFSV